MPELTWYAAAAMVPLLASTRITFERALMISTNKCHSTDDENGVVLSAEAEEEAAEGEGAVVVPRAREKSKRETRSKGTGSDTPTRNDPPRSDFRVRGRANFAVTASS